MTESGAALPVDSQGRNRRLAKDTQNIATSLGRFRHGQQTGHDAAVPVPPHQRIGRIGGRDKPDWDGKVFRSVSITR
jgi:hypothetical protein